MEIEVLIHTDNDGVSQIVDNKDRKLVKAFYSKRKGQYSIMTLRDEEDKRNNQMNRHLWGIVYHAFIPDHFETPIDVHIHFSDKFLKQESIFDFDEKTLQAEIEKILKEARKTGKSILSTQIINDKVEIIWVRSTASLSKEDFLEYEKNVIREGGSLGIEFP